MQPEIIIPKETTQKRNPKLKIFVVVVVIGLFILLVICLISTYIIVAQKPAGLNSTNLPNKEEETTVSYIPSYTAPKYETDNSSQNFEGKFVKTNSPVGWTIKEYSTAEGMKYPVETPGVSYSGLTGLEIFDENNKIMFSMRGADGIGGSGGCSEVAKFDDTPQNYITDIVDTTEILGFGTTTVVNFHNVTYKSIPFLSIEFRRFTNTLYIDIDEDPNTYSTGCGISSQFVTLQDLNFTVNDNDTNYTINVYEFKLSDNASETKLVQLDSVLTFMKKS